MLRIDIKFSPCGWNDIKGMAVRHIRENRITIESYWEDHLLASRHYKMTAGEESAGCFSINGGAMITLFIVSPKYAFLAQELFARVKKYEQVTHAMVATGDEFFLSHCIDDYARIEKQAFFSTYTDREIPQERRVPLTLRLADVIEDEEILKLSGDFLKEEIVQIKAGFAPLKIYVAEAQGDTVGFGVVQYGRVLDDIASIGMYVREQYRCKGFAANILFSLKQLVTEKGYRAFSGCWYYNHNSKKSMESAGAYSKSRLLKFYF